MKKKHTFYDCHNQNVLILGLNHSHIVDSVYRQKQKCESEEITPTIPTTYLFINLFFILQKAEPGSVFQQMPGSR